MPDEFKMVMIAGSLATSRYQDDAASEDELNEEGGLIRMAFASQAEAAAYKAGVEAVHDWFKFNVYSEDHLYKKERFAALLKATDKPIKLVAFGGERANGAYADGSPYEKMLEDGNTVAVHGFDTRDEADCFMGGVNAADGWDRVMIVTEDKFQETLRTNRQIKDEEAAEEVTMGLMQALEERGYEGTASEKGTDVFTLPRSDGHQVRVEFMAEARTYEVRVVARRGGVTPIMSFSAERNRAVEREVLDMAVACEAWTVEREPRAGISSLDVACDIIWKHVGQTDGGVAGQFFDVYDYSTGRNDAGAHWQDEGPEFMMRYLLQERFQREADYGFDEWRRKVYTDPGADFTQPAQAVRGPGM
jgi:dsDNA-binding SOS-regulon protein